LFGGLRSRGFDSGGFGNFNDDESFEGDEEEK